jgi:hypothetical protein
MCWCYRLEIIFDTKKDSPTGDELEILGMLVDNYENENFPVDFTNKKKISINFYGFHR